MAIKLISFAAALAAGAAFAASPEAPRDPLAGDGNAFSDPVFQDFVETADGYLNPKNAAGLRGDYRDAPVSPALPTLKNPAPAPGGDLCAPPAAPAAREVPGAPLSHYKVTFSGEKGPIGSHVWPLDAERPYAREYVFLSVTPRGAVSRGLLEKLEACADFRFSGEKTIHYGKGRRTVLLGWAPYASIEKILRLEGVSGASVEKKSAGIPFKTRVKITLKVPFQNKPDAFVPEFIKTLGSRNDFAAENWFRLPARGANSRFTVFNVNGTLPVDMVGEVSRSPFVTAVEFRDSSL